MNRSYFAWNSIARANQIRSRRRGREVVERIVVSRRNSRQAHRQWLSSPRSMRAVLRQSWHALLLSQTQREVFAAHDGPVRVQSLQEQSQRLDAHEWRACTSFVCLVAAHQRRNQIFTWNSVRDPSLPRRWNLPRVSGQASRQRSARVRWFDPLDRVATVPRRWFPQSLWCSCSAHCHAPRISPRT